MESRSTSLQAMSVSLLASHCAKPIVQVARVKVRLCMLGYKFLHF